jgi:hypothetical protein
MADDIVERPNEQGTGAPCGTGSRPTGQAASRLDAPRFDPSRIWVRFGADGCIRKWSRQPFEGGKLFVAAPSTVEQSDG